MKQTYELNWIWKNFNENGDKVQNHTKDELLKMCSTIFTESVQGSCLMPWDHEVCSYLNIKGLEELYELVPERDVLSTLDELIFECDGCGWWYSREDEIEEGVCAHCVEE